MTDIAWRAWGQPVFDEAKAQNKPVLLSISAVWCQFCRNMDEQTYGNEAIAQYITDNLIPVRVDSDQRPDVNARYTMGGWPTTCILTPEGDVIWGGTFLPPDGMAQLLPQVLNAFHNDKQGLANHVTTQRQEMAQKLNAPPLNPTLVVSNEIVRIAVIGMKQNFDFAFGGFGREQKFPHTEALELCLEQYSHSLRAGTPDTDLRIMLEKTLNGIAKGGLRDAGGLGYFRYTQSPDWSNPRFEKMLEDNALIARTFAHAYQLLGDEEYKSAGEHALRFLNETLYIEEHGVWGGSQAADDEYYSQPLDERAEWNPPTVDSVVLAGQNALAVRANVAWWAATGDTAALALAKRGMDFVLQHLVADDGNIAHFLPGEKGEDADDDSDTEVVVPTGLLSDSADVCAACLDLYEAGQGVLYLDRAETIAGWVRDNLEDPLSGGYFDTKPSPEAPGNLRLETKDLPDNMQMNDALLRLFLATGEEEYAQIAQRGLQAFLLAAPQLGFFGAGLSLAAERALHQPIIVHLLGQGSDVRTQSLLESAHRPYRYERFVQPLDPDLPDDAQHIGNLEYPVPTEPVAYVCVGTRCLEPTSVASTLIERIEKEG